jgi:hypothetical protein
MSRWVVRAILGVMTCTAAFGAPDATAASGLPTLSTIVPSGGIPGPEGTRYVTRSDDGVTTVREIGADGVIHSRTIDGNFSVPAVALDRSPSGLSADDTTLALTQLRRPTRRGPTRMLTLDARDLSVAHRIALEGLFSFDAISPDGSRIYLIQYLAARDPTRYAVRAYDVQAGRLLPEPIVDPNEPPGEMRGFPMTRETGTDGRWAYTLYDGGGDEPFVHALDTAEGRAVCIDLDGLVTQREVGRMTMRLEGSGSELALVTPKGTAAVIDTETLEARAPTEPAPASSAHGGGDGLVWIVVAGAVIGVIGGAVIGLSRRRAGGLAARDL